MVARSRFGEVVLAGQSSSHRPLACWSGAALNVRAGVPVTVAGQDGFQQPGAGRRQRGAHRLLQHAQPAPGAEQASSQCSQPAYLPGGDLRELRREPPFPPPPEGAPPARPQAGPRRSPR